MKKRLLLSTLALILLLCFVTLFAACGDQDLESILKKLEENSEEGTIGVRIASDYDDKQIQTKLNQLAVENGVFVKLHISGEDSENGKTEFDIAFGSGRNVFYYLTDDYEGYFDLSDETCYVVYEKDDQGEWTKKITNYSDNTTKELLVQTVSQAHWASIATYLGWYSTIATTNNAAKTTATVAGRACDQYTLVNIENGVAFEQIVCIDKATGACLKYSASVGGYGASAAASLECTEFSVSYTPALPTVDAAHTTVEEGTLGGDGGSSNHGTDENGQNEDPSNPGTGENGQNEDPSNPGTGNGDDGGEGGSVVIGPSTPMRDNYPAAQYRDRFQQLFANGILVEYTFQVQDKYHSGTEYVEGHVYAAVKGDYGFVKNDYTNLNEYYEFRTDRAVVYPYSPSTGDYDRFGYEIPYDTLTRSEFILERIFGYNTGWMPYSSETTYALSRDWANANDIFQSLLFRYTRRGVDAGKYAVSSITRQGREYDAFIFMENVTEANEHDNGYYIIIDKETGICAIWFCAPETRFTADQIKTGDDVVIRMFEHIGHNPGDANDTSTILYSYPDIVSGSGSAALLTNGLDITYSVIPKNKSVTSTPTVFRYAVSGNVFYMSMNGNEEAYIDASSNEYYIHYVSKNGEWTASRKYYSDYGTDDSVQYRSRSDLMEKTRALIGQRFLLPNTYARQSGMTKTEITFLDRTADQFLLENQNYLYLFVIDRATGIPLRSEVSVNNYVFGSDAFTVTDLTILDSSVGLTLPDVTVTDPHAGGNGEGNEGNDGGDGGDPESGATVTVSDDYPSQETSAFADAMMGRFADADGFAFALKITADRDEEFTVRYIIRQTDNCVVFYMEGNDEKACLEIYENRYALYEFSEENWVISEEGALTAEERKEKIASFANDMFQTLYLDDSFREISLTKTEGTFLNRAVDLYTGDVSEKHIHYSYDFRMDRESGICLYLSFSEAEYFIVMEVTEFETEAVIPAHTPAA